MKKQFIILLSLLFLAPLYINAQTKVGDKAKGKASYYSNKFNGKKTASGEKYLASKLTCAHLKLPYGTMLKVTNLRNMKSVTLKVNDRGPFTKGRIIDVSFGAASKLDMLNEGVATVEIEILSLGEAAVKAKKEPKLVEKEPKKTETKQTVTAKKTTVAPKTTTTTAKKTTSSVKPENFASGKTYSVWGTKVTPKVYGVQIGSFEDAEEAIDIGKEAISLGLKEIYIQCGWANNKRVYRLIYGAYKTVNDAKEAVNKAGSKGFKGGFVKKHF